MGWPWLVSNGEYFADFRVQYFAIPNIALRIQAHKNSHPKSAIKYLWIDDSRDFSYHRISQEAMRIATGCAPEQNAALPRAFLISHWSQVYRSLPVTLRLSGEPYRDRGFDSPVLKLASELHGDTSNNQMWTNMWDFGKNSRHRRQKGDPMLREISWNMPAMFRCSLPISSS